MLDQRCEVLEPVGPEWPGASGAFHAEIQRRHVELVVSLRRQRRIADQRIDRTRHTQLGGELGRDLRFPQSTGHPDARHRQLELAEEPAQLVAVGRGRRERIRRPEYRVARTGGRDPVAQPLDRGGIAAKVTGRRVMRPQLRGLGGLAVRQRERRDQADRSGG